MRTTLDLDEKLLQSAAAFAPELSKTALLEEALRAFLEREARRRILAGALYQPGVEAPPRSRAP